jgi:hypothetical protein
MSSKYQIFVSSTYVDLKDQRDLVIKAILEMGHIPVGMEMFSAADEEQWNIIKRQIEQSDYYVVIVANRYGSVTADGVSYTEKEYDFAVSIGVPTLGFVLDSHAAWPTQFTDTASQPVAALNLFKDKVKRKHVSFWKAADDLYGKASIALMKAFTAYPREGWVRASQVADVRMSTELTRLSSENSELREKIKALGAKKKERQAQEIRSTFDILSKNKREMYIWRKGGSEYEKTKPSSLLQIFLSLAPELLIDQSVEEMARHVAQMICHIEPHDFRWEYPVPNNLVKSWLTDFATLELAKPSDKKKPVADKSEYWTLTEKGNELLRAIRRLELEKKLDAVAANPPDDAENKAMESARGKAD